jgi:DNA repair exonuclease SbcCD ATPase subunit
VLERGRGFGHFRSGLSREVAAREWRPTSRDRRHGADPPAKTHCRSIDSLRGKRARMSDKPADDDLERRQREAEIKKIEAEAEALRKPQGFFHANWLAIATAIATLLTAFGGSAALISALAQLRTADLTLQSRQSLAEVTQKKDEAREKLLDARESQIKLKEDTQALQGQKKTLADETTALADKTKSLRAEEGKLEHTLADKQAEVDSAITFSNRLKDLVAVERAQQEAQEVQLVAVKAKLENAAKATRNEIAKSALTRAVTGIGPSVSAGSRLVYLEYFDKQTGKAMTGLQAELKKQGFTAPGVQEVDQRHLNVAQPNEIRYFRAEDKALAQQVADIANHYFAKACGNPTKIAPRKHGTSTPTSQLEVWTEFTCEKT